MRGRKVARFVRAHTHTAQERDAGAFMALRNHYDAHCIVCGSCKPKLALWPKKKEEEERVTKTSKKKIARKIRI